MPVSGILPGSAGFVQMPGGIFTPDPKSNIPIPGRVDQTGLRRGYTYDPVHTKWLPVPRDWVMPDFSSYIYVGIEMVIGNQPALHWVDVATGKDTLWPHGEDIYGFPTALRPEGVYGAPGPEILVLVDPLGVRYTVDQGHYGLFEVITTSWLYAARSDSGAAVQLSEVDRINANTGTVTTWFTDPSATNLPIGLDAAGSPIIASGVLSHRTNQMVASRIWIARIPSTGTSPESNLLYSNDSDPLVMMGSPIVSHGALWFATDHGIYEYDFQSGFRQASPFSGYIAGGCV
jgi:hypothetical protein